MKKITYLIKKRVFMEKQFQFLIFCCQLPGNELVVENK